MPASRARRRTMYHASTRDMDRSDSLPVLPDGRAEERTFLFSRDPCRRDILIQILFKLMVAAHFVDLAALLFQAQPPAFLEREIILHLQTHHGGNPREGVDHDADKGSVAQAHRMRRIDLF